MRSYGTTNAAPHPSAPPVGAAGDTYYNTVDHQFYISSGTAWAVMSGGGGATNATNLTLNAQTGTSYILVLTDAGKFVTMTNAAASTLTVPSNSSVAFPVGTYIEGAQLGAGQVTITPGSGVTINAAPGLKVAAQYGSFGLVKTATDTWLAMGRLSA
jgi:hypothetical protein